MNELPSVKTHPVIVSLITVTFFLGILVAGGILGWTIRAAMESKAELSVVLDDSQFMQKLEGWTQGWINSLNQRTEAFYEQNKDIPQCISKPMPQYYRDADYELRNKR